MVSTYSVIFVPSITIVDDLSGETFEGPAVLHFLQGVCCQAVAYQYSGDVVTVRYYPLVDCR